MLGKVFKHEMKSTSKLFLPLLIGFIAISILCKFAYESSYSVFLLNNKLLKTVTIIFFILYFIYSIALFIMTAVFIVTHFYKTMVSDQGYLTNTLPVKPSTLINAKLMAAVLWQLIAIVFFCLSISIFSLGHIKMTDLEELLQRIGILYADMSIYLNVPVFLLEVTIFALVTLISGPLMLYAAVALGHLFQKHRILWATVFYVIIYIVMLYVNEIYFSICNYSAPIYDGSNCNVDILQHYLQFTTILILICTAGFYAITDYVLTKRLNLD